MDTSGDSNGKTALAAMDLLERALDLPSADRRGWIIAETDGNDALQLATLKLLSQDGSNASAIVTGQAIQAAPTASSEIPERVGAYRITRLIGEGGMGAVFEGVRDKDDFDLQVAIKVIRTGLLSAPLIERFERERQVLAGLNHSGIARLFDGGQLEDGSPYFVMEYIDGVPITVWCDENELTQTERLDTFQQVCRALRYAHQNLIVHRDITPSNVMVSHEGMVKLIDFGIAKPQSEEEVSGAADKPSLASLTFTPGYAAPERSAGAPPTVLSDIYSLGKLLEALIGTAGTAPELKAIAAKGSALEPADRYASVDALMEDIEQFKSGHPISAAPGGWLYRLRKFVGRNTIGTVATIGSIALLAGGLVATTTLYQRAETARAEATDHFNSTRELTQFLLNEVTEELEDLPGSRPLQRKITEKSSSFLEVLREASARDPSLSKDYAQALISAADTMTQSGGNNLGDPGTGIEYFGEAIEILEGLTSEVEQSENVELLKLTAKHKFAYANLYHLNKFESGAKELREVEQELIEFTAENPTDYSAAALLLETSAYLMAAQALTASLNDEELRQRRKSLAAKIEELIVRFPSKDELVLQYATFLWAASSSVYETYRRHPDSSIAFSNRSIFESAIEQSDEAYSLIVSTQNAAPENKGLIYSLSWALEDSVPMNAMDTDWVTDIDEFAEQYGEIGRSKGRKAIQTIVANTPEFSDRVKRGEQLMSRIEYAQSQLSRLKDWEGEEFSYYEVKHYNLMAAGFVAKNMLYDVDASITHFSEALLLSEQYLTLHSEELAVVFQRTNAQIELAMAYRADMTLYGTDRADEICRLLRPANEVVDMIIGEMDSSSLQEEEFVWFKEQIDLYQCEN